MFARGQRHVSLGECSRAQCIIAKNLTSGSGDVRRLKGIAGCQLRIGDWRVILIEDARSITVVAVGNRKEIYD
jgi:mRNA-degrading endonuclease RelE of RelBE toxin-antitoxin system